MSPASLLRLVLLGAIWGSSFAFMRAAVPDFGPLPLIAIRLALAAAFLAGVALLLRRPLQLKDRTGHFLLIGFLNSALPFFLFAFAAQTLPAAMLAVFNSMAPAFGALIARLWLKTPVTSNTLVGLALGLAGVGLIAWEQVTGAGLKSTHEEIVIALMAGLAAPLCYGIVSTYIKRTSTSVSPFDNAHGSMWAATLLSLPLMFLVPFAGTPSLPDWYAASTLGLVCTGAAYLLSFKLIADLGPTRALTVTFLVPVFGAIWGVLFLGEKLTPLFICGGLLVVLGTALANGYLSTKQP